MENKDVKEANHNGADQTVPMCRLIYVCDIRIGLSRFPRDDAHLEKHGILMVLTTVPERRMG